MDAKVALHVQCARAAATPADWSRAFQNQRFQQLVKFKASRVRPAVLIYFLTYMLLSSAAGFAPNLMATKLIGSFSFGYAFILFTYIVAWAVAFWYVRVADVEFDPMKTLAVKSIEMEGFGK